MAYFSITYQLNEKKDYPKLWDEFDRLNAVKVQNSQYFIDLDNTTKEVKNHFAEFVDEDDLLMVVKFTIRPQFTKAKKGTNDWLNSKFN